MTASETAIRALIENWTTAVHAGDLDGVLTDHTDDVQMFDVPPPNEVRGIDAYRETWPPFFDWQRNGGTFELVSLDVTAGDDVAFAAALLRCGTEEGLKKDPNTRLRLGRAEFTSRRLRAGRCELGPESQGSSSSGSPK